MVWIPLISKTFQSSQIQTEDSKQIKIQIQEFRSIMYIYLLGLDLWNIIKRNRNNQQSLDLCDGHVIPRDSKNNYGF